MNFSTSAKPTISSNLRLISARRHAEDRAIKIDVLAPGKLAVESRPNLQQARHPTANFDATSGRLGDATQNFEKRALARAVAPNDANNFTSGDFKADILQRPEFFSFGGRGVPRQPTERRSERTRQRLAKALCPLAISADDILLRELLDLDRYGFASVHDQSESARMNV